MTATTQLQQSRKYAQAFCRSVYADILRWGDSEMLTLLCRTHQHKADKTFMDCVMKGNNVIYDPAKMEDGDFYNPMIDGFIQWSEEYKCHIYLGMYWEGMEIADGYTDETRPDGARMMLNNARGKLRWSRENKEWQRQF